MNQRKDSADISPYDNGGRKIAVAGKEYFLSTDEGTPDYLVQTAIDSVERIRSLDRFFGKDSGMKFKIKFK